jgi:hypothetical protein
MKASDLTFEQHYPNFPEFRRFGIELQYMEAGLILAIQALRMKSGIPIIPSPVIDGWYRFTGSITSRHYAINRRSDAGDIFAKKGRILETWLVAQTMPIFNGFGVYLDTKGPDGSKWIMLHLDTRPGERLFWVRDNRTYFSLHTNPLHFWNRIRKAIEIDTQ